MLKNLEKACSWVVSQLEAGVNWVRDNWPAIQAKAAEKDLLKSKLVKSTASNKLRRLGSSGFLLRM